MPPSGDKKSRLTGVTIGDHLLEVETAIETGETEQVSTVVSVDGQVRKKTTSYPPPMADDEELERYIDQQHAAVEAGVRGKVEALLARRQKRPEPSDQERDRYRGLVRSSCARQDFAGAKEILAGARALFPTDPFLKAYEEWVRSKLEPG